MATERDQACIRIGRQLAKGTIATVALGAAAVGVSTLAFAAPASAKGDSVSKVVTIKTEHVAKVGTVLASSTGLTLYRYTVDPAGEVTCTGACAKAWPPMLLPKGVTHIKVPHGVKGLTVRKVHGGRLQVFFHNQALYTFVSDTKKGQDTGQGVENEWYAVLADGKSSAATPASSPSSTPSSSSSTSTGSTTPSSSSPTSGGSAGTATTTPTTSRTSNTTPATSSPTSGPPATNPTPVTTPTPTTTPTTKPPVPPTTTTTTTMTPPTGGAGF